MNLRRKSKRQSQRAQCRGRSPEVGHKAVYNLADLRKIYRTNPGETGQGVAAIYDLTKEKDI